VTVDGWFRRWIDSRIDVGEKTKKLDRNAADRFKPLIGDVETSELRLAEVQEAVSKLSGELEPRTVGTYLSSLRMALDFTGLDRNPRSRSSATCSSRGRSQSRRRALMFSRSWSAFRSGCDFRS